MKYGVYKSAKEPYAEGTFDDLPLKTLIDRCTTSWKLLDPPWIIRSWDTKRIVYESPKAIELREKEMNESKADTRRNGKINPEKPGVYKVLIVGHRNPYYSRWNGKNWLNTCFNEESARETNNDSISDDLKEKLFTWEPIEMDGTTADDWHSKDEKPMIVGTYEIKIKSKDCSETKETKEYSYWNGEYWCCAVLSPEQAKEYSSISGSLYSNEFEWQWKLFEADKFTADEETNKEPMEQATPKTAADFLANAILLQAQRAKLYDKDGEKERSMAKTVEAFNAICGQQINRQTSLIDEFSHIQRNYLTESQGWLFMCLLKMVRSEAKAEPHADSIEDLVSYASLYAEARINGK